MRILILSTLPDHAWGGSENLWYFCAKTLIKRGHTVVISVNSNMAKHANISEAKSEHFKVIPRDPIRLQRLRQTLDQITRRSQQYHLLALQADVKKNPPDLILVNQCVNHDGGQWLSFLEQIDAPYVALSQAAADFQWPNDDVAAVSAQLYSQSRQNFFVSQANHKLTELQCGIDIPNASVVANPFQVAYHQPIKWPKLQKPTLAVVARLEPHSKGHDLLLPAIRDLNNKFDFQVNLYGAGACVNSVISMIKHYGLGNVSYCGFSNDIQQLWTENEILLLPSRSEGFPLSLIEASLCGRPAIVTDVGGNCDLVMEGQTGFVIPHRETSSIRETLERALINHDSWREMGKKAQLQAQAIIPEDPPLIFAMQLEQFANN